MSDSFSVNRRNPNHWDIWTNKGRAFRIRGKGAEGLDSEGSFCVIGEHDFNGLVADGFATVGGAMTFVTDILMLSTGVTDND